MASPSARRTRAHSAWNVPAWTSRPRLADEADDPLAQLGGGPVRERDREDPPRRDALDADEVRDPVGEDPRLARAGAGQDQQRPLGRRDRAGLLGVEGADDLLGSLLPSRLDGGGVGGGGGDCRVLARRDRIGRASRPAPRASRAPRRGRRMPCRRPPRRPRWRRRARGRRSGDDGWGSPAHCRSGRSPGRDGARRGCGDRGQLAGATWSGGGAVTVTGSSHFEKVDVDGQRRCRRPS